MHASFYSGYGFGSGVYPESGLGSGVNGKWLLFNVIIKKFYCSSQILV